MSGVGVGSCDADVTPATSLEAVCFKIPEVEDGVALHRLVAACPPLDGNSLYCNLLHCTHFAATSVAARKGMELVGFVSAYPVPGRADTLFVWQVAVASSMRGHGIGRRMLRHVLGRNAGFQYLETSITPGNALSWRLFASLARELGAGMTREPWFDREKHLDNHAEDELLVRIGPF